MQNKLFSDLQVLLTPYKVQQPMLTGSGISGTFNSMAVDAPFIFCHHGRYHMLHIGFDGEGYQTGLAVSDDLLHWYHKGVVLPREKGTGWDNVGAAGTWILKENNGLAEVPSLKKVDGRYWMVYHSYPEAGYETGAAEIGLAWTRDEELLDWHRLEQPVFSWKGGADWEKGGLYKACLLEKDGLFYLYYNAKNETWSNWVEQIGVATSPDLQHWTRFEGNPILQVEKGAWDSLFASDPCVVEKDGLWLMFYYGFDGQHAQDGLAMSEDMLHWQKVQGPILKYGAPGELDAIHAHKPAVIQKDGILYHYYCAVREYREGDAAKSLGNEFRTIAVATSRPIEV